MKWTIRQEQPGDEAAIHAVTQAAFSGQANASGGEATVEATVPGRLRDAGALVLSLVALEKGAVIGHIAVSPATVDGARWLAIGPVSVHPNKQGQGVGSGLVRTALSIAQRYGRAGCVVLGNPKFYGHFGFAGAKGLTYRGATSPNLQALVVEADATRGAVEFHASFDGFEL